MTERIQNLLSLIRSGKHHIYRHKISYRPVEELARCNMPDEERSAERLREVLEAQEPIILPGQRILFLRTAENLPDIFTETEWEKIYKSNFIHEHSRVCNICPNYEKTIRRGLLAEKERCAQAKNGASPSEIRWLNCVEKSIDAILNFAERYRQKALELGMAEEAAILKRVPAYGASTFREALQFFRILHFTLWCEGEYQNTLGRFDQYMFPYLEKDLAAGRLNEEEAFELLEEFFLTFNLDNDLYPGIQQGDNGQSLMLGGVIPGSGGKDGFNLLSDMCLQASGELLVIDPKINLRVSSRTPLSVYEKGTRLTKAGLGFPQYSNDDVVIEGLVKKGYRREDAENYTVAACWEFIIPEYGMEIPNIGAVNFPELINRTISEHLEESRSYEEFYHFFTEALNHNCAEINDNIQSIYMVPAPFMSLLMADCIENRRDISFGNRYNNFGYHGVGISSAVDSLAVVKKCIFTEKSLTKQQALSIVRGDADSALLARLRYEEPKFGDGDAWVNDIAVTLCHDFAKATENLRNIRGGCVRAGTGSAMFYLWYAEHVGSMLSGHCKGEAFSANYAPELFVRNKGPLSVISSLTAPDFTEVANGGPLTMEFHSSVFRDEDGTEKVARLVYQFIRHGGLQLQLNSVNRKTLLEAQRDPDSYRNLIVRIWGWSAYFVELDREFQDHVIARQEFQV